MDPTPDKISWCRARLQSHDFSNALDPCAALGLPHLAKALRLWNAGGCPRGRGKVTAGLVFGDILEVDADPLGGPAQA